MTTPPVSTKLALVLALVAAGSASSAVAAQIDHILLGIDDLDRGIEAFEQATGVKPIYGGKHPGGTHNALVSLGDGTYLEIIALQRGVTPQGEFAGLKELHTLTPVGWAVSAQDSAQLRKSLSTASMPVTEPVPGSRTTPTGFTLSWQSFVLKDNFAEAPFFIVWSEPTPHPAKTSPGGCKVQQWHVAGQNFKNLEQLRSALDLQFDLAEAAQPSMRLKLTCPKGSVTF